MEQEKKIDVNKEVQIARTLGNLIEHNICDRQETSRPVPEELRMVLRNRIEKNVVVSLAGDSKSEVEVAGGFSLREAEYKNVNVGAVVLVDAALGKQRTDEVISLALDEVWKHDDRPKFGSREEMVEYVMLVMGQIRERESKFKFDIGKLAEDDEAKKVALYRMEAIFHAAFKMLRVVSFETADESQKYQKNRFEKLRQRIIKGEIRQVKRQNAAPQLLAMEDVSEEGKKIRHLNPGVLGAILEGMMKK